VETVTVAATRGSFELSGMPVLVVSVVVCAAIAFAVVTGLKAFRSRNERGA